MGKPRSGLTSELQSIIGFRSDGKTNLYFDPPEGTKLNYPCIVYKLAKGETLFASNKPYIFTRAYDVTYMTKDANDPNVDKIAYGMPMCELTTSFVTENMHHHQYRIYY